MDYIFVYGTLRKGFGNHRRFLNNPGAEFIGNAVTKEKYAMYASGIPFVNKNHKVSNIKGEVYLVDLYVLKNIDALEGHPDWYYREKVDCILDDGKEIKAWIYFNNFASEESIVESGDFLDYRKSLFPEYREID